MGPIGWPEIIIIIVVAAAIVVVVRLINRSRAPTSESVKVSLKDLDDLRAQGIITPEEYTAKRADIISRM